MYDYKVLIPAAVVVIVVLVVVLAIDADVVVPVVVTDVLVVVSVAVYSLRHTTDIHHNAQPCYCVMGDKLFL